MKKQSIIIFIVLVLIFGAVILAFKSTPKNNKDNNTNNPETTENNTNNDRSNVSREEILYFYSDGCHWCQEQKPIIEELEKEEVKFKYMDVGKNRDLINEYNISGTPTFMIGDKKLEGFQDKDVINKLWKENSE